MIRLGLIRHGHTAWNRAGRLQGRTDIPLDDEARAHLAALQLPGAFADFDLVSSPLHRAVETAQIITGRTPRTDDALIEMNWGIWEGQHGKELRADPDSGYRDMEFWSWSFRPPEGEMLSDVRDRLVPWVTTLQRDTIAVCHIGIMRVILAVAHDWPFEGAAPFAVKRDRVFEIQIDGPKWTALPTPTRLDRIPA